MAIKLRECLDILYIKSLWFSCFRWVSNHYKWIVWKLASLERCYPTRAAGKFLTVDNVFEELKYRWDDSMLSIYRFQLYGHISFCTWNFMDFRYDREVNHGHRSAIKKILEGNASPSLMMVLCISAIYSCPDQSDNKLEVDKIDNNEDSNGNKSLSASNRNMSAKIELTDGWYVVVLTLLHCFQTERHQQFPVSTSSQVFTWRIVRYGTFRTTRKKKAFLRTKASGTMLFSLLMGTWLWLITTNVFDLIICTPSWQIWGASLFGWSGPVSFHEVCLIPWSIN